jgi:hypothetical protein
MAPRALRSGRSAARANRNAAVRLVSITRCHSARVSRRSGLRIMIPALETTASSRPNCATNIFTAREMLSSSRTSPSNRATLRSRGEKARFNPLPGLSMIPTRQPAASRCWAMARPMPLAPPVTSATGFAVAMPVNPKSYSRSTGVSGREPHSVHEPS